MKRYLVTGGAGFIGSAVVRKLILETEHPVRVVDSLTYAGNLDSIESVSRSPRFTFVKADVSDATRMNEIVAAYEPDVIMHLAAESHVDRSIDGPAAFVQTNVVGTFTVLQAALAFWTSLPSARKESFRFHHVSTDEVFGSLAESGLFDEDSPYRPTSPYSASKAAADHFVRAWQHTYGLPTVISNCSNNFGPYHFPEKLIPLAILNALEGKPVPIYGNGQNVRDWLYVDDHAAALLLVAEKGRIGESYAIGARAERSNIEVVRAICSILDDVAPNPAMTRDALITFVADRPGHDHRYAFDASKAERELGWRPREDFESALRKTVVWYLENRQWWLPLRTGRYKGERLGTSRPLRAD